MNILLVRALLIVMLFSGVAKAETVLYCQSELNSGIAKEGGSWKTFPFVEERFTIKFNDDFSKLQGLDNRQGFSCTVPYSGTPNYIVCFSKYSDGEVFAYGKDTRRFLHSYPRGLGYIENGTDTSNLSAGSCESF